MSFITFAGFTIDMHGSTSFLLILLDVIAELGIHERFLTVSTAVLHVFCPQKLFADFIAEQLLVNVSGVKHPFIGCDLICRREKLFLRAQHRYRFHQVARKYLIP